MSQALQHILDADIVREEYDFYRCEKCRRLCTKLEWDAAMGLHGTGRVCPCGGIKFSPSNVTWRDYVLPQVIRYARAGSSDRSEADAKLCEDLILEARLEGLTEAAIQEAVRQLSEAQQQIGNRPSSVNAAPSLWDRLCARWPWLRMEIVP